MARHQYFFGDHLKTGKVLGFFKGFADDFEKVKYILEHLDADDPIELGRGNDGSITIRFNPNASGGGSSYTPPHPFDLANVTKGDSAWTTTSMTCVNCYALDGREFVNGGTLSASASGAGTLYAKLTHSTSDADASLSLYFSATAPDNTTDYSVTYIPLYSFTYDAGRWTVAVDYRTAPAFVKAN